MQRDYDTDNPMYKETIIQTDVEIDDNTEKPTYKQTILRPNLRTNVQ